jgi:hypothetical protein
MRGWRKAIAVSALAAGSAVAQAHGVPASATSTVGRSLPNVPASATSLGPMGISGDRGEMVPTLRRLPRRGSVLPVGIPYYVPVAVEYAGEAAELRVPPEEAPSPPQRIEIVITDRREAPAAEPAPRASTPTASAERGEELPVTVLVMRDGTRREVRNYAIMGRTLYDLAGERMIPIALDAVDLEATVRENEAAGHHFRLPKG